MRTPEETTPITEEPGKITADPAYRKEKEEWTDSGCQPENAFFDSLEKLEADVKAGLVDDLERQMREKNARLLMETGELSPYLYELIRKAVKIDESGNLEKF